MNNVRMSIEAIFDHINRSDISLQKSVPVVIHKRVFQL
jgi:hypothetical protein